MVEYILSLLECGVVYKSSTIFPKARLKSHFQPCIYVLRKLMLLFTFSKSQKYESYELNAFDLYLIMYGYICNTYLPQ